MTLENIRPDEIQNLDFFDSGDHYFKEVCQTIDQAISDIYFEVYIFNMDRIGQMILNHLAKASRKGVKVFLVVDGIGSFTAIKKLKSYCRSEKIRLKVYRPIPYIGKLIYKLNWFLRNLNKRTHRKIIIIDKMYLFIGSFNIAEIHSETYNSGTLWYDIGFKVKSTELKNLHDVLFAQTKKYAQFLKFQFRKTIFTNFRSSHSVFTRRFSNKLLISKIINSKRRVWLFTPYFIPPQKILKALLAANERHHNVVLILPEKSDHKIVDLASKYLIRKLLRKQIQIYTLKNQFIHAKGVLCDDWFTSGSHNLNHRSLIHDLEIDLMSNNPIFMEKIEIFWKKIFSNSKKCYLNEFESENRIIKIKQTIFYWFRYWL